MNKHNIPDDGINRSDTEASAKDDSHSRWDSASGSDQVAWDYYDSVIAKQLVHFALKNASLSLADLYHTLLSARLKCEWVKTKKPKNQQEVQYYSTCELDSDYDGPGFGKNRPGGSKERGIYDHWGNQVSALVKERLGKSVCYHRIIGLSFIEYDTTWEPSLRHPFGTVFERLNPHFKRLISTDNIFDFLCIASTLMYEFANYPPVLRGSAAGNTWLIDKIFLERFGNKMNAPDNMSIRPLLYDWTSFFEMPGQYTPFYVISATAKIIGLLPGLTEEQNNYITTTLPELMRLDPTFCMEKRRGAWQELKSYIAGAMKMTSLSDDQRKCLAQLQEGILEFVEPSQVMLKLFYYIMSIDDYDITIENIRSCIGDKDFEVTMRRLESLFVLEKRFLEDHSKLFNDPDYLSQLQDVSLLQRIPPNKHRQLENCLPTLHENEGAKPDANNLESPSSVDDEDNIRSEIKALLPHNNKINSLVPVALLSGGITVKYMNNLSIEQIHALTTRGAVLLYNANLYIHATDLVDDSISEIENNILKNIAWHFCKETDFLPIEDPAIRKLLLSVTELYQAGRVKLSSLVGETLRVTEDKVFKALLEECSDDIKSTSALPESYTTAVINCALQLAEVNNREDMIREVLEKVPDFNAVDIKGLTPLHRASIKGQHKIVKALLDKGADINRTNLEGETALDIAARYGHLEVVKAFLNKGVSTIINEVNSQGLSPLMIAAMKNHPEVVTALLEGGADPNINWSQKKGGGTALHFAIEPGHTDVVKILLANKADCSSPKSSGFTALLSAVESGHTEIVTAILAHGADINQAGPGGQTPLHCAAGKDSLEIVTILLAKGADFDKADDSGRTPLHEAVFWGHPEAIKALLDKGADCDRADRTGQSPLDLAARSRNPEVARIMKEYSEKKKTEMNKKVGSTVEMHNAVEKSPATLLAEQHWRKGVLSEEQPQKKREVEEQQGLQSKGATL